MLFAKPLKTLLSLLADGCFHSGTELANTLGVSRSAVWKYLQQLSSLGVEFTALSGKGYKLTQAIQLLDQQAIYQQLDDYALNLINRLEIHDSLDSTNSYLRGLARLQDATAMICLAEYQTAGKGRRGRSWVSPFGQNIYLSILWQYQEGPASLAGLSLALGVAVVTALQQLGLTDCRLKWPNDIVYQQRKLGGILVEISGETGGPCHAVIGLGINCYLSNQQAAAIDQPWIDLSTALTADVYPHRNQLVGLLLKQLLPLIASYHMQNLPNYLRLWRQYDDLLGKNVAIFHGQQTITGTVLGVDDHGYLLLATSDGQVQRFASGEVSFNQS